MEGGETPRPAATGFFAFDKSKNVENPGNEAVTGKIILLIYLYITS